MSLPERDSLEAEVESLAAKLRHTMDIIGTMISQDTGSNRPQQSYPTRRSTRSTRNGTGERKELPALQDILETLKDLESKILAISVQIQVRTSLCPTTLKVKSREANEQAECLETDKSDTESQSGLTTPPANGHDEEESLSDATTPSSATRDTRDTKDTRTKPDITLQSPDAPMPFRLSLGDMGKNLIASLTKIITREDFKNMIHIPDVQLDLDLVRSRLETSDFDCQYAGNYFVSGPTDEGYVHVYVSDNRDDFRWPQFPEDTDVPSPEAARKWLDAFFHKPPKHHVSYFSGHLDGIPYGDLLDPGGELRNIPGLEDLHAPYWHIGADQSANRKHFEDLNCLTIARGLRSANLVFAGFKLWILIATHHTEKFENFITSNWTCNGCSQRVGHQSLLIAPNRLEREGIDFSIKVAGPGTLVVPYLGQYHGVVNMGPCIAQSINFMLPGDDLISEELRCCEECGLSDFTFQHGIARVPAPEITCPQSYKQSDKRKASVSLHTPAPKRRTIKPPMPSGRATSKLVTEIQAAIRTADACCIMPTIDTSKHTQPEVLKVALKMAASVWSSMAVKQFVCVIDELRNRHQKLMTLENRNDLKQKIKCLEENDRQDVLHAVRRRLFQWSVADQIDGGKFDPQVRAGGRFNKSSDAWAKEFGIDVKALQYYLQEGRIWARICGPYHGLLPFILASVNSFEITKKDWVYLSEKKQRATLQAFHEMLDADRTRQLCRLGKDLDEMMLLGKEKSFSWDSKDVDTTKAALVDLIS